MKLAAAINRSLQADMQADLVAAGELSADEAASIGTLVEGARRGIELVDVIQRLEKLEAAQARARGTRR